MEGQTIPVYDAVCLRSIRRVTEIFSGKWSFLVLEQLHIGTMRFSELSRALGASTKSLTDTLRHLEVNGIIQRTVRPTVPVTVEYSLTDKGRSFDKVLLAMKEWENANESGMIEKRSGSR
ncbi:winged helix-turn-helix transcriptional regulator [Chordicoccus furentiruminis]|uniref:winged helix-turn-helix transcriptional regulator n=1 Tax=Chordicoccus furentiruminis TaxID=2709410 RepID=UPI0023A856A1|nr:helix-turn-helix domain-containing protein [Chordicoccus furentiruminis]